MTTSIVLYAPSVHTGGGLVLLRSLLQAWPAGEPMRAFFDARARNALPLPPLTQAHWVQPSLSARLGAEQQLRDVARPGDTVLCFHGLPPLYRNAGRVVVFQQNRIHLGLMPLHNFGPRTALRLALERVIARAFRHHAADYIVQTPTMARELQRWHGGRPSIRVLPFADPVCVPATAEPSWDFVYVADGVVHKNHQRLLQAWVLLAQQGLRPRLALTLGARDQALIDQVDELRRSTGVEVDNHGVITHEQVLALYGRSRALIYPSLGESFGLPLLEARQVGLPILAAELDYVRDVCEPTQSFDPLSPISIARAVRRFLEQPEPVLAVQSPAALWAALGSEQAVS
jgi:glycosyltransferase involved in cell wall biosynthesis